MIGAPATGSLRGRIADCEVVLTRLAERSACVDLLGCACREIAIGCGFQRVVLSEVGRGRWRPTAAHFAREDELDRWAADWLDRPVDLLERPLHEREVVCARRPALVRETGSPLVHELVRAGGASSYVVAPIVIGDAVAGLLHADHDAARPCDEADREILRAAAAGFGVLYERSSFLDAAAGQRAGVLAALARVEALPEDHGRRSGEGRHAGLDELTGRERDVYMVMCAGARNAAIAEQLHIAPGTVKTHVANILRKLGAANRTQAIARRAGA
jgi:DNA-binding CsgD family transcriptional regulator